MLEDNKAARSNAESAASETPASFSYCCECGTWDAHDATCRCCGFDFRASSAGEAKAGND